MASQVQVVDDFGLEHVAVARADRAVNAWEELLGGAGPADLVESLEHQDGETGLGEIARCHQTVVSSPDDDCVVRAQGTAP